MIEQRIKAAKREMELLFLLSIFYMISQFVSQMRNETITAGSVILFVLPTIFSAISIGGYYKNPRVAAIFASLFCGYFIISGTVNLGNDTVIQLVQILFMSYVLYQQYRILKDSKYN